MAATATFIVCWTLLYGAHPGQENCTPGMAYDQAQMVMASILKTDSYRDLSMRLDAKAALTDGLVMGGGTGRPSRIHGIPPQPNPCQ